MVLMTKRMRQVLGSWDECMRGSAAVLLQHQCMHSAENTFAPRTCPVRQILALVIPTCRASADLLASLCHCRLASSNSKRSASARWLARAAGAEAGGSCDMQRWRVIARKVKPTTLWRLASSAQSDSDFAASCAPLALSPSCCLNCVLFLTGQCDNLPAGTPVIAMQLAAAAHPPCQLPAPFLARRVGAQWAWQRTACAPVGPRLTAAASADRQRCGANVLGKPRSHAWWCRQT